MAQHPNWFTTPANSGCFAVKGIRTIAALWTAASKWFKKKGIFRYIKALEEIRKVQKNQKTEIGREKVALEYLENNSKSAAELEKAKQVCSLWLLYLMLLHLQELLTYKTSFICSEVFSVSRAIWFS